MYEGFPRNVYFARRANGEGAIKIGCSRFPDYRCRELGYICRAKMEMLAVVLGGFPEERRMHERFAHLRLEGEWFDAAPELLDFIAEVKAAGSLPESEGETRDERIARLYCGGMTLQQVADDVGLTRERIRQILRWDLKILSRPEKRAA